MGHTVGKDVYRKLGKKIDGLETRAPWNDTLYAILKELYTHDEAELIVKMPYGLANFAQIKKATGHENAGLQKLLDNLCDKGLIMDIYMNNEYYYIISPLIIGIFEFTMMRTRGELNFKEWARLFHEYLNDENTFYKANLKNNEKIVPLRAVPWEDSLDDSEYVEILDYEKASAIIDKAQRFSIGICSCRHEKLHVGEKSCDVPLETCSSLDFSADYMIKHGLAREVSRSEMMDNLARSKELNLVLSADNVKKNISFICHCCGCCCNLLLGVTKFGYPNGIVTSNYIARVDEEDCIECGTCAEYCPINAIKMPENGIPEINLSLCMGCGVCALNCSTETLKLAKRPQRVIHPEDTFERIVLQSLERGVLQNLFFPEPQNKSHAFMRVFVGAFLKLPPVKKALISNTLRSSFLNTMRKKA